MEHKPRITAQGLAYAGLMTALVFVSNYLSIPTGYSRLHVANAVCLLAGMLFGGLRGAIIAGLGSAFYDFTFPAYVAVSWITFINKGAMALACGIIVTDQKNHWSPAVISVIGAVAGAVCYIALYLTKSYIQLRWVTPVPVDSIPVALSSKLFSSLTNGAFAVAVAPLLYHALKPALEQQGILRALR